MKKIKLIGMIFMWLTMPVILLESLEISGGKLKLVLYEQTGRFNLYYRAAEDGERYIPFLSERNPASSFATLVIKDKVHILGTSPGFVQKIEETHLGARITWISPQVAVTESFSFISDSAINIVVTIKNLSQEDLVVGMGYLFDIDSGENAATSLEINTQTPVSMETVADTRLPITSWTTLSARSGAVAQDGFRVKVNDAAVTKPDRIIFADWQRIYALIWDLIRMGGKEFRPVQSPLADAAVYHNYDPVVLSPAKERIIVISIEGISSVSRELQADSGVAAGSSAETIEKMNILNNLLEDVNKKIKNGEMLSPADYNQIMTLLEEISQDPDKEYHDMVNRVNILNNLLEVINSMIDSGKHSAEDIARLNEILQRLENKNK